MTYKTSEGHVTVGKTTWKVQDFQDNLTTNTFPDVKFGPLYRNTTYIPIVTIKTQLTYRGEDESNHIFPNITETCYGRSFGTTEWPCVNGDGTIPKDHVCNNPHAPDCTDGSDEAKHLCTGGINNIVTGSLVGYFIFGIVAISLGKYFYDYVH